MLRSKLSKVTCFNRLFQYGHLSRRCSTVDNDNHSDIDLETKLRKLRNVGISAHIDSGKTTLTERLLYFCGKISEMHEVRGKDKVGATMDFMELERERGITIKSAATFVTWKGHHINIIDTPGHVDFTIEVERSLRVLDGAILVVCAVGGVQSQTMTVNRQMARYSVPFLIFINKTDRGNADPYKALKELKSKLGYNAAFIYTPLGFGGDFNGLYDLVKRKAFFFNDATGTNVTTGPLPEEFKETVKIERKMLIESLSNVDEIIGERYLNDEEPTEDELYDAIKRSVLKRTFQPVIVGSALRNKAIQLLLDDIIRYLPNPMEVKNYANDLSEENNKIELIADNDKTRSLALLAFKLEASKHGQLTYMRVYQGTLVRGDTLINTRSGDKLRVPRLVKMHANEMKDIDQAVAGEICATFGMDCYSGDTFVHLGDPMIACESIFIPEPVMSLSVESENNMDYVRLSKALARFSKEDPTFITYTDDETKELIIAGMGELHLDIYIQRLKSEYGCNIKTGPPRVSYRETIKEIIPFNYLHKKQSGGAGQFARVIGKIEPIGKYFENEFVNKTTHNTLSKAFIAGVSKGFHEFCESSSVSGNKMTGIRFILEDAETHVVDSSDYAFKLATVNALKTSLNQMNVTILQPFMTVEIVFPLEYHSTVTTSLSQKESKIIDTEFHNDYYLLKTFIPLREMFGFSAFLRKITQGRGEFSMEFSHYDDCDINLKTDIISEYQKYRTH